MKFKGRVLSNDFLVCVRIYEYNEKGEKVWFSKLAKGMDGELTRSTVSKCLDRLFDRGMIDGGWEKVDGRWTRTLSVTCDFRGFVKSLYDVTEESEG